MPKLNWHLPSSTQSIDSALRLALSAECGRGPRSTDGHEQQRMFRLAADALEQPMRSVVGPLPHWPHACAIRQRRSPAGRYGGHGGVGVRDTAVTLAARLGSWVRFLCCMRAGKGVHTVARGDVVVTAASGTVGGHHVRALLQDEGTCHPDRGHCRHQAKPLVQSRCDDTLFAKRPHRRLSTRLRDGQRWSLTGGPIIGAFPT
jgi:hypothetical protein